MGFDELLAKYTGECGRYQILIIIALNVIVIPDSFNTMEIVFTSYTPDFWPAGEYSLDRISWCSYFISNKITAMLMSNRHTDCIVQRKDPQLLSECPRELVEIPCCFMGQGLIGRESERGQSSWHYAHYHPYEIIHSGGLTHICVSNLNHRCPRQWFVVRSAPSIIWFNDGILSFDPFETNQENLNQPFSHNKYVWECRLQFRFDLNMINTWESPVSSWWTHNNTSCPYTRVTTLLTCFKWA